MFARWRVGEVAAGFAALNGRAGETAEAAFLGLGEVGFKDRTPSSNLEGRECIRRRTRGTESKIARSGVSDGEQATRTGQVGSE